MIIESRALLARAPHSNPGGATYAQHPEEVEKILESTAKPESCVI